MKKLLVLGCLLFAGVVSANPYNWTVTRIIDGDTVAVAAPWLPDPLKKEISVRVWGVDTPEKGHRAKCPKEDERGKASTKFTQKALSEAKEIKIHLRDWDKYGGRVLGTVIIDGIDLRTELIRNGFAVPYHGEKKDHDWCK